MVFALKKRQEGLKKFLRVHNRLQIFRRIQKCKPFWPTVRHFAIKCEKLVFLGPQFLGTLEIF